jgi:ABC-type phosphate transport system ATPase subunit
VIKSSDSTQTTFTRLIGYIEDIKTLSGKAILFNGNEVKWSANKTAPFVKPIDSLKVQKNNTVMPTTYPNVAFGTQNNQLRKRYYLRMLRYGQMRKKEEQTF